MTKGRHGGGTTDAAVLFEGGLLWSTADWAFPRLAQLLVSDGRIQAIGADLEVPAGGERVELAGGTLLPAFGDGHAHPKQAGLEAIFAPVRGDSIDEVLDGVRSWAEANPEADWIYGGGFDLALASDGVFPAELLDQVLADRPIVLQSSDYHNVWCNSEALRRAGITSATPDPHDGEIVRHRDGRPVGTLREWGATDLVLNCIPPLDQALELSALRNATGLCAAAGIVWVQDAWVDPPDVPVYLAAARTGDLQVRVNLALRVDPALWTGQLAEFGELRGTVEALGHPRLACRTVKFFVDGVIEGGTAAMLEPYADCPHSRGLPNWEAPELTAAVRAFSAAGFQVHLHAIGDAAIRDALDAIEASIDLIRAADLRPVIAHLQVIHPADHRRLGELGVISCFQPLWAQPDPTQEVLTAPRLGPERAALQYPIHSLTSLGAPVSFGSDWPVTALSPLAGIVTAITRQTPDGRPPGGWFPDERIDLRTAVTAYTEGVARQAFRDDAGRLAVGAIADLVWIDRDLTAATAADLRAARVAGTWLAGVRVG